MNRVIILGNIGRDPEIRRTKAGDPVASFSVATSKKIGGTESTQWHNIVCFKKTAELVEKYLSKGSKVLIEGELSYTEYEDKNKVKKQKTEIIASNVQFVDSKKKDGSQKIQSEVDDVSIPF
jgi:single-strand DNA-binding protein